MKLGKLPIKRDTKCVVTTEPPSASELVGKINERPPRKKKVTFTVRERLQKFIVQ